MAVANANAIGIGIGIGDVGEGEALGSSRAVPARDDGLTGVDRAGSAIRGEQPSWRGNKRLKRAFFLSAFAALADPASRAYCDKKINQGKHRAQALLCLVRRRADVLFAMLRDGTFYEPRPATSA